MRQKLEHLDLVSCMLLCNVFYTSRCSFFLFPPNNTTKQMPLKTFHNLALVCLFLTSKTENFRFHVYLLQVKSE